MAENPCGLSRTGERLTGVERSRCFLVTIIPGDGNTYGLQFSETNGIPENTALVATISPVNLSRFTGAIRDALRASNLPDTSVGPNQVKPIHIDEAPGVHLVLTVLAVQSLKRRARCREIIDGIAAMGDGEAYYWYAKVTHPDIGGRCLRSLRLLLSNDS